LTDHERRDIGSRLENWARVYRDTYRAGISPTAAFCDQLRREALGEVGSPERRRVDDIDAERIEHAMRTLETKHRLMMYWCYIKQAHPGEVCRSLHIAHRPATVFTTAFRAAQLAVEQATQPNNKFHDA